MAVKKTYRINLRNYGSPPAVMVSQYDEGYAIAFEIFDGPLPVLASSLSGYTFKLKGRRPGNPPFLAYEFEGTLATALNAVVSFEIDTTMTGRAGKGTAELVILDEENDVKFASVNFAVYTEPAAVPDGSIDADVQRAMEIAEEVQEIVDTAAEEVKGEAEAWAVGQRDGEDVPSTDPTYENNAKYYAKQAQGIADSIGIDATLSISGKAADAKKTGDEISSLKEDLNGKVSTVNGESPDANGNVDIDTDAVIDAESMPEMTDPEKLYRYNGKIYYNDGTGWTEVGTGSGSIDQETLDLLIVKKDVNTDLTEETHEAYKAITKATGEIVDATQSNEIVYAYPIPTGYVFVSFYATARVSGSNKYAFYSAESYSECGAETLIGEVTLYTSATSYTVEIPEGAKTLLVQVRYAPDFIYATKQINESKADNEISELMADVQSFPASLFQLGFVNSVGDIGTLNPKGIVMKDIYYTDKTIVIEFADGFKGGIYYYNSDGTYKNSNGELTTLQARTILPNSHFRIDLRNIDGQRAYNYMIADYATKVTFASDKAEQDADIQTGVEGAMNALVAKMYQKGSAPTTFTRRPCIIVAGQSNIDGRVPAADLPSDITMPLNSIMVSNNSGAFSAYNVTSYWDITTSMFSELNKIGSLFYDVKYSVGGTSISEYGDSANHWTPFYENISGGLSHSLLLTFENKIRTAIGANPDTFDIRAFVWQQGEGDRSGTSKQASLSYYKNFKCLVAYVRGIAGNEKLPVICGTVSHLSGQYDPVVEEATLRVAEEDPYMTCIDMSGATLLDSYHFDADSAVYFGRKAYDALIDFGVITGTKINPTPPWENS